MTLSPSHSDFDLAACEASAAFRAWAGTQAPVLRSCDVSEASFRTPGPYIFQAYHGTTHDFSVFDAGRIGNHEGAFGRINYFTTSLSDAERNYAGLGPDLSSRIEHETEMLAADIECNPEAFDLPETACYEACRDKAWKIINARLDGGRPQVMSLYLRIDRPFIVDGALSARKGGFRKDTTPALFPDLENAWSEAEEKVLDQEGLSSLEGDERTEALEDHEDAVIEAVDEIHDDAVTRITDLFAEAANALEAPVPDMPDNMLVELGDLTHDAFYRAINGCDSIQLMEGLDGLVSTEFFARIVKGLGYDGIVLKNVDRHFESMQIPAGAAHLHIFDSHRHQIKSTDNTGSFSFSDPDIYR